MTVLNEASVPQRPAVGDARPIKPAAQPFFWPSPPGVRYPAAAALEASEPCLIVGLNGRQTRASLRGVSLAERQVFVQLPSARSPMPLAFSQFQSVLLESPLCALEGGASDAGGRPDRPYSVHLVGGQVLHGDTIGQVSNELGLFLFPPLDGLGTVQRLFIPKEALLRSALTPANSAGADGQRASAAPQEIAPAEEGLFLLPLDDDDDDSAGPHTVSKVDTPHALMTAIARQRSMPLVRIGETLVSMGLITPSQLQEVLAQQQADPTVPLGELLVAMNLVTRQDLTQALARKMGYPLVDLDQFPIDPNALVKVPFHVAMRLKLIPLMLRDAALIVAMADPSKRDALSELEFITQSKVLPVLADFNVLERAIRDAYAKLGADVPPDPTSGYPEAEMDLDALNSGKLVEDLERAGMDADADEMPLEQSDNSLVRLVNTMVMEAHSQGVSDIHIECYPGREKVKIRFRKDGALMPYLELPHNYRSALIARIKIMCDLDISERRRPQDGKINFARYVPQYRLELRVATIPTANGMEDVVMRILSSARPLPLDKIGLSPRNFGKLTEALHRPYGMILCVGPTGSGKTTALHSALGAINVAERKIWTAEDPVEITQPGLRQVQVNHKLDWTFAKALRAFLRADPDVIMVGEMRDAETASMGIEASLTGHLVLSTLHTNSAAETITRLLDMGMDPFSFADSLLLVMAMRLVKKHCAACKVSEPAPAEWVDELIAEYQYPIAHQAGRADPATWPAEWQTEALRSEWLARFGQAGQFVRYRSVGCAECRQTGYKGRAAIHEVLMVDPEIRRLIQTGSRAELVLQQGLLAGMRTLRQDGIEKVLAGITSMEEVRANSNA